MSNLSLEMFGNRWEVPKIRGADPPPVPRIPPGVLMALSVGGTWDLLLTN